MAEERNGISTGEVLLGAIAIYLLWRQGSIFSSFNTGGNPVSNSTGGSNGVGGGGGTGASSGKSGCGCSGSMTTLLASPIAGVPSAIGYSGPFEGS